MSVKQSLRTIFVCAALELGVLSGVPIRPDEVRALMQQLSAPRLAHELPADEEGGGDSPPGVPDPAPGGACFRSAGADIIGGSCTCWEVVQR